MRAPRLRREQFEQASAAAAAPSLAVSPNRNILGLQQQAAPLAMGYDRPQQQQEPAHLRSPKRRQTEAAVAAVPRAAAPAHTAAVAGDIAGLVRELQQLAARGTVESLGGFLDANSGKSDVVNGSVPPHSRTALIIAAAHRKVLQMTLLLGAGADTERTDIHGWTAFHYACSSGSVEATETLLRAGCNPDAKEKNGRTGAALAIEQGFSDIVGLVENHAGPSPAAAAVRAVDRPPPQPEEVESPRQLQQPTTQQQLQQHQQQRQQQQRQQLQHQQQPRQHQHQQQPRQQQQASATSVDSPLRAQSIGEDSRASMDSGANLRLFSTQFDLLLQ